MTAPANIRANVQVPFPATVTSSAPVAISKQNGVWTVSLNMPSIGQLTSLPAGALLLGFNPGNASWFSFNIVQLMNSAQTVTNRLASNFVVTSNTTLANSGISIPVTPGNYSFRASLQITGGTAAGAKVAIATTATTTQANNYGYLISGTSILTYAQNTSLPATYSTAATAGAITCIVEGTIVVTVAGNLTVQFAQGTSQAASSTLLAGSFLQLYPTNN